MRDLMSTAIAASLLTTFGWILCQVVPVDTGDQCDKNAQPLPVNTPTNSSYTDTSILFCLFVC